MDDLATARSIAFEVNGCARSVTPSAGMTLLQVLRDQLGLTGTKEGCEDGSCGTCVVTMDGAMARACRVPIERAAGKRVLTIEGLARDGELHPLQTAFLETGAVQCGFCTPGAVMAASALLARNPAPTRTQIAKALGSNLCRCTGYNAMIDAVERVARQGRGGDGEPAQDAIPGNVLDEMRAKVLGTAAYGADLALPGMLYARVLRSPHAHAEIVAIDDSEARALPGVMAVVSARDVPGLNRYGRQLKDQRVLCDGRVRQIGDPVAAVAAESPQIAAHALERIRVEYRLLPAVFDPEQALGEHAPRIHDEGNLLSERSKAWGDAQGALAASDVVLDETFSTQFCEHAYLEPEAALAYCDENGRLVVRSANQHPGLHLRTVAETMALPPERVRILPPVVGGGFGGKTDVSCEGVAALLALRTGRPIKIVYSRAESFASTTKRHPFRIRCRLGASRDGTLTALTADILADTGAYASAGPLILTRAFVSMVGPYRIRNVALHGRVVYTNNTLAGAMRGFGAPQVAFALESMVDAMARKLAIDPLELRMRNRRRTDPAIATAQDREQESAYAATLDAVRPYYEAAVAARRAQCAKPARIRRGVGIASMRYGVGYVSADPPVVNVVLEPDGSVTLYSGAMDMGQGTDAALARIVADELELPLERVRVVSGDTDVTPDNGASTGSRVIYTEGNAVKEAAARAKDAILAAAAGLMRMSYEKLALRAGAVVPHPETGMSAPSVSFEQVARALGRDGKPLRFEGRFRAQPVPDALSASANPYLVYVTATHVAEVEVDTATGEVRVLRVIAVHDVGRVVYPLGLKGQIEGAVSMGLGFALKEEFVPGETESFQQYRLPNARETPEVVTLMIEMGDPSAGLGAKGAAECATVAVAPAIINAIADATGVRVHRLPATPPRLLAMLHGDRSG